MNGSERPTAVIQRVDMSGPRSGASAARSTSEDALFVGYREVGLTDGLGIETRPCACGGLVHADPGRPGPGVAAHQFTGRHKAWRSAQDAA